jgi:hypothetical protein
VWCADTAGVSVRDNPTSPADWLVTSDNRIWRWPSDRTSGFVILDVADRDRLRSRGRAIGVP